jgi:hypothetical protein
MRRYTVDGQPLFSRVNVPNISIKGGSQTLSWNFNCDLKNAEHE